ncbi:MAG: hypothetical protein AMJ65_01640 [Phycisphaerae bacterium SG8_4]|nr:MAG: hypothetical protein AMJ65_01640 [Phycisphaerae bacterium SG8_4]
MSSKTETQVSIPGTSAQEQRILDALEVLGIGTQRQLDIGGLGQIARGKLEASPEDRALIEQSVQASREIAERAAREQYADLASQVEAGALERGIEGSSIEAVNRAVMGRELQRQLADITARTQQQTSEQLLSLPFQRAGMQLSANQQLLNQLLGATSPVLQTRLQERLVQQKQTSEVQPGLGDVLAGPASSLARGYGTTL